MKGLDAFERSPSRMLAWVCGSFLVGIAVAPLFLWVPFAILLTSIAVFIFLWTVARARPARFVFLMVVFFVFGVWRYTLTEWPQNIPTVGERTGFAVRVEGVVRGIESRFSGSRAVLDDVSVADEAVQGRLLVWLPEHSALSIGETVIFACRLSKPEPIESFRYDRHLRAQGIGAVCGYPEYLDRRASTGKTLHSVIYTGIGRIKTFLLDRLFLIAPEPHASFLSGLLFGGGSLLSASLREDFSRTGASHILAASGFNVALFTLWFLGWASTTFLKRRGAILATVALLFAYTVAAGATPAVVRAAVMAGMILVAKWAGRKPHTVNVLLATGSILLLFNPRLLLDDVGFQLSFVAVSAILCAGGRWKKWADFLPERWNIRESFTASVVATVFTLPIVVWHFGVVSPVSLLTNVLVLPLLLFLMAVQLLALAFGMISILLGTIASVIPVAVSSLVLHVIAWESALPFAGVSVVASRAVAVLIAATLVAVWFYVAHHKK